MSVTQNRDERTTPARVGSHVTYSNGYGPDWHGVIVGYSGDDISVQMGNGRIQTYHPSELAYQEQREAGTHD